MRVVSAARIEAILNIMNSPSNRIIDISRTENGAPEPVTLSEIKAQCIVTYSDDDALLTALGVKARAMIENYCNISIVSKTIVMIADLYQEWELPYGPVTGINGVQIRQGTEGSGPASYASAASGWGTDGVEFISFRPSEAGDFNINRPFTGNFCPDNTRRYKISYTSGYSVVPDQLKQAILLQTAWLYEHRGEEVDTPCEASLIYSKPFKRELWF